VARYQERIRKPCLTDGTLDLERYGEQEMNYDKTGEKRETVFISKVTPGDDELVLWLAPSP